MLSSQAKKLNYETGSAEGYLAFDKVCFQKHDTCINEMLFVSVYQTQMMNLRLNGVLGLSPGSSNVILSNGREITNSYIEQLKNEGLIDRRVFSLYLTDKDRDADSSVFTAGGYDVDRFAFN